MKTRTVTLLSIFHAEVGVLLTISGLIPSGGEIARAIHNDDVYSLKQLFREGMVLPNDRMLHGPSILYVSCKHFVFLTKQYAWLRLRRNPIFESTETCCDT